MAGEATGTVGKVRGMVGKALPWVIGLAVVGMVFGAPIVPPGTPATEVVTTGLKTAWNTVAGGVTNLVSGPTLMASSGYSISPSGAAIYSHTFSGHAMTASGVSLGSTGAAAGASAASSTVPLVSGAPGGLHFVQ